MNGEREAEQTVARLTDEVRREPVPDIDWTALEASLMARVRSATPVAARRGVRWPVSIALAAVALLAAVAAVIVLRGGARPETVASGETTTGENGTGAGVDGDTVALGASITAKAQSVIVEHRGHATWTLEPNSEAHLESVGDVVTVALDRGVLSARVVKSPRPESFVVRVERTRVAVHGTAFRVERLPSSVRIAVTEGVVAVGPIGQSPFELVAPSSATVTLDGIRTDVSSTAPTPAAVATTAVAEAPTGETAAPAAPGKERPKTQATEPADLARITNAGVARVVDGVQECFGEYTVPRGDLRVTVRTEMSLRVQASGQIGEATFNPPLVPAVRSCVDTTVTKIRLAPSKDGFAVDRVLELER